MMHAVMFMFLLLGSIGNNDDDEGEEDEDKARKEL